MAKQVLMCPVCRQSLNLTERTWRCEQGHSYDVAKQGYVNLHVVQHKHSKNPGDTPESVDARRAFFARWLLSAFTAGCSRFIKAIRCKSNTRYRMW